MMFNIFCLAIALRCFRADGSYWFVIWPGTAAHECWHWLVGLCTGATPTHFTIIPKDEGEDKVLGSVSFQNLTWFNRVPPAMAPLLSIPAVYWISHNIQFGWNWTSALIVWAMASALSQSWPSPADWSIAFDEKMGLLFWIACAVSLFFI